jgi:thioesterase domain-containing protein/acyl carrier protein
MMSLVSGIERDVDQREVAEVCVFPCTAAQKGFWLLDQLQPGNPACNIAVLFELTGTLLPSLLEAAFNEVVRRHETLRTRLATMNGAPVQVIEPCSHIEVPVHDLRSILEPARTAEAERLASEEATRPFLLSRLPLIRASLLRLDEERHILLVTLHHAVCDGWSIGILTDELGAIYEALLERRPSPLPDLPVQFADYAIWEENSLASGVATNQLTYWKAKLAGMTKLELPTDLPRPSSQTFNGAIRSILLPRELTDSLSRFSHEQGFTLFVTMLAAFKALMHGWSGQNDIVIGTLYAGRHRMELEPLIGVFVNSLALRTSVSGEMTFIDLTRSVQQTVLEAFDHAEVPFGKLVEEIKPDRDQIYQPMFCVNFIFQRDFIKPIRFGGVTLKAIPSKAAGSIYDLNFFLVERAEGWRASVEFNTDLYQESTIATLLKRYESLLEKAVKNPAGRISEFSIYELGIGTGIANPAARKDPPMDRKQSYVAPRNSVESDVSRVWEETMGIRPIGVTVDFFDLGGHSLLAAQLLSNLEKKLGKRMSLAEFFEARTIEKMALALTCENHARQGALTTVQAGGAKQPLFMIHGVGGSIMGLGLLSRYLGIDRPIYAFQSYDVSEPVQLTSRLEQVAAQYIAEIRTKQSHGPYFLLGHSSGGMIAFEMAQQLRQQGEQVALLGMLDTYQFTYYTEMSEKLRYKLRQAARTMKLHVQEILHNGRPLSYIWGRIKSKYLRIAYAVYHLAGRELPPSLVAVEHLNWFTVRHYKPAPYPGSLVLFRALNREAHEDGDYLLGWGGLAKGGIEVYDIPGTHEEMGWEPNVRVLAKAINRCLDKAQAEDQIEPGPAAHAASSSQ